MQTSILIGLALGTFVSEDLTSISAGLMARDGVIGLGPAMTACVAGVYVGDLGLWLAGRVFGRRLLRLSWIARGLDPVALADLGARIDGNLPLAVIGSRFLPGSRLPMYLAVGIFGERSVAFAVWSFVAVLLWTPLLVWLTRTFGTAPTAPLVGELNGLLRTAASAAVILAAWRFGLRAMARFSVWTPP